MLAHHAASAPQRPTRSSWYTVLELHIFRVCDEVAKTEFPADNNPGLGSAVRTWQFSESRLPATTAKLHSRDLSIRHVTGSSDGRPRRAVRNRS